MTGILDGVRVVEVAEYGFVPSAAAILAEWGADVVKIEHPVRGDAIRGITAFGVPQEVDGFRYLWESFNRGKRSVGVDITTDEGRELVLGLARSADVFMTNFLPDARRKLRLDVADIRAVNPQVVYARGSAHGERGPQSGKGGFDSLTYWYRSGAGSAAMPASGTDLVFLPGPGFGDIQTGMTLAGGIAGALYQRERTGHAPVVDVSLLAGGIWAMHTSLAGANLAGVEELARRDRTAVNNPIDNVYETADGRFIALAMFQADRYWADFCTAVGRPDLIDDPRFADIEVRAENRKACIEILDDVFRARPLAEWTEILEKQPGAWSVIQRVGDLNRDEQAWANGYLQNVEYADGRTITLATSPVQFDAEIPALRPAPGHAEHTDEVLLEAGHDWDELIEMKLRGTIT